MDDRSDKIVEKTTCFNEHEQRSLPCQKSECKMWINDRSCLNCCLICSKQSHTLQQIGDKFGLTRMRICQMEKLIMQRVRIKQTMRDLVLT